MAKQEEIAPVSAEKLRDMTRARDDIPDNRKPRCYDQCVELPGKVGDQIAGQGDAYQD